MKNISLFIISIFAALALGFGVAWWLKPVTHTHHLHEEEGHVAEGQQWTCSMHPHIQQPTEGNCPICGMALVPMAQGSDLEDPRSLAMTREALALAQVETQVLKAGASVMGSLRLSGKIAIDQTRIAHQVSHLEGRVERLYVSSVGEPIRRGQRLASIYSSQWIKAQQELLVAERLKATHPELLPLAREKLRSWRLSEAQIEGIITKGEIDQYVEIYAEVSGVVQERQVEEGSHVKPGTLMFNVVNLGQVWAELEVYEKDLSQIKVGDEVLLRSAALPGKTFTSKIDYINPAIDSERRVALARVILTNPELGFKPEMYVEAELRLGATEQSPIWIPASAVLWTGTHSVVYLKVPSAHTPSFQFREVQLGKRVGRQYEVIAGLEVGEEVVIEGAFFIDAATQIRNLPAMMNQNVSIKGEAHQLDFRSSVTQEFQTLLGELADAYLRVKDALIEDEVEVAQDKLMAFQAILKRDFSVMLEAKARNLWQQQRQLMLINSQKMQETASISEQRMHFKPLSERLLETLETYGYLGDTLYLQHCPMALDWEGADWLSREAEVVNPYFGDKMLHCGELVHPLSSESD